jgi:hypothetical protein
LPVVQYERAPPREYVLRPDFPLVYAFRIRAYTALNRFDYAHALERKLHAPFTDVEMYNLALAQNDTAGMAKHVAKLEALPRWGHTVLDLRFAPVSLAATCSTRSSESLGREKSVATRVSYRTAKNNKSRGSYPSSNESLSLLGITTIYAPDRVRNVDSR